MVPIFVLHLLTCKVWPVEHCLGFHQVCVWSHWKRSRKVWHSSHTLRDGIYYTKVIATKTRLFRWTKETKKGHKENRIWELTAIASWFCLINTVHQFLWLFCCSPQHSDGHPLSYHHHYSGKHLVLPLLWSHHRTARHGTMGDNTLRLNVFNLGRC